MYAPGWLRSLSAAAFVQHVGQQLAVGGLGNVHEKWFWLTFRGGLAECDVQWRVVAWPDSAAVTCWETAFMPVYSSLTHALAAALADVLWFIEGSEDEQMDPDDAVKVLEGVAHLLSKLSSDQRSELIDLLGSMAEAESDPARREFLEGFPEGFGLLDDAV
ncbi:MULTISPECIES: hypothetical protein [unclassified Streptomyces]|uniref:hypothetical protein n=1 Tax=unclassified Streptomyces TaxID=2593676 RepID=UPI00336A1E6D